MSATNERTVHVDLDSLTKQLAACAASVASRAGSKVQNLEAAAHQITTVEEACELAMSLLLLAGWCGDAENRDVGYEVLERLEPYREATT